MSALVLGVCPVCRENVIDEVWGGGQDRWDKHLSKQARLQEDDGAVPAGHRVDRSEGGAHQVVAAGMHSDAGLTGGQGWQMDIPGSGGSLGSSCKMGGWEQYAGAHWAVIRETLHMRWERRCSAGRGLISSLHFPIFLHDIIIINIVN